MNIRNLILLLLPYSNLIEEHNDSFGSYLIFELDVRGSNNRLHIREYEDGYYQKEYRVGFEPDFKLSSYNVYDVYHHYDDVENATLNFVKFLSVHPIKAVHEWTDWSSNCQHDAIELRFADGAATMFSYENCHSDYQIPYWLIESQYHKVIKSGKRIIKMDMDDNNKISYGILNLSDVC